MDFAISMSFGTTQIYIILIVEVIHHHHRHFLLRGYSREEGVLFLFNTKHSETSLHYTRISS